MIKMLRPLTIIAVLSTHGIAITDLSANPKASDPGSRDLSGAYLCISYTSRNVDEEHSDKEMELVRVMNSDGFQTYKANWTFNRDGVVTYGRGIGILQGDRLAISYTLTNDSNQDQINGLYDYRIARLNNLWYLNGTWIRNNTQHQMGVTSCAQERKTG